MGYIIDIEYSMTAEELAKFKRLSDELQMNIGDCVRMCANERCEDYLVMFEQGEGMSEVVAEPVSEETGE